MLRTSSRLKLLSLLLLAPAGLASAQAQAQPQQQQQRPAQQRPADAPPQLERIEPGSDEPTTTIPPRQRTRITEKRGNDGSVTEVEVQSGRSRYIMKPNVAPGNAQPGDAQSNSIRAPQWQVMEFDWGNPKKQDAAGQSANAAPSPAPAKPGTPARADAPPPPALEPVEKK
ncbi:hypothetical protein [Massilia consociata]|uniref:DUF2782 domain-containing protein n=1 Tax=Massilia consociata TaxID=760117 RepID=A0ABV6FCW3_9BURK